MQPSSRITSRLWYVRRGDTLAGPFPIEALRQELVLGRLAGVDEISPDGAQWYAPGQLQDVLSESVSSQGMDDWSRERAMARQRWAEQRSGTERRRSPRAPEPDRRAFPITVRAPATRRDEAATAGAERATAFVALLLVAAVLLGATVYGTSNPVPVDLDVRPLSQ